MLLITVLNVSSPNQHTKNYYPWGNYDWLKKLLMNYWTHKDIF